MFCRRLVCNLWKGNEHILFDFHQANQSLCDFWSFRFEYIYHLFLNLKSFKTPWKKAAHNENLIQRSCRLAFSPEAFVVWWAANCYTLVYTFSQPTAPACWLVLWIQSTITVSLAVATWLLIVALWKTAWETVNKTAHVYALSSKASLPIEGTFFIFSAFETLARLSNALFTFLTNKRSFIARSMEIVFYSWVCTGFTFAWEIFFVAFRCNTAMGWIRGPNIHNFRAIFWTNLRARPPANSHFRGNILARNIKVVDNWIITAYFALIHEIDPFSIFSNSAKFWIWWSDVLDIWWAILVIFLIIRAP